MSRNKTLFMIMVIALFFLSGCWDRKELNDLAIELGWGLDKEKNNQIRITAQFIIPSNVGTSQTGGGGGKGKSFFIETGTGKDTLEAVQKMQTKLSREVFRGHRRVILLGEKLAKQGLAPILDTYSRDPEIRLRADALIVKGHTAKQFLEASYPLESIPALGALKEHMQIGGMGDTSLLNFLKAATSEGINPTLPVINLTGSSKGFEVTGIGIFNKNLQLIGFLNPSEQKMFLWIIDRLNQHILTANMPQGTGNAGLFLTKLNRKIKPSIQGRTIKCDIVLSGEGVIRENNTKLDLTQAKNLTLLEHVFEKATENQASQTLKRVQTQYGTDIFGIGEAIHQKYPSQWKGLKKNWDKQFREVQMSVHASLVIRRVGLTGPSMQLNNSDIKK
ncbi:Ger(x)C family spore germination protein [Bacillus sp. BRMEA1]|uniref:Ger(x)C family spore germination protein n=1 Tax=Neobacillus endophyticus TaxID=2738405 RepID=UPI001563F641|nr:Ger(x)C family spore germination protein [Neobacillus endophyticus]NRD77000.1 Ger(x)C family spore germination protein [Neobacillus endophyticus]